MFQYKIIIFQGQFSIISAFPIGNSTESWHLYCNSLRADVLLRQNGPYSVQNRPKMMDFMLKRMSVIPRRP